MRTKNVSIISYPKKSVSIYILKIPLTLKDPEVNL